jgi:integrase
MPKPRDKSGLYKQRKSNNYWCRFWHQGEEVRKSTGTADPREAAVAARRIRADYERDNPTPVKGKGPCLADMAAADVKRAEDAGATRAHAKALESLWVVIMRKLGPNTLLTAMQPRLYDLMEDYIGRRRRQDNVLGQSIRREVAAIKRAYEIAHRRRLIGSMPTSSSWPSVKGDPLDQGRRGKLRSPAIISKVLGELHENARDEVLFVVLTGLRATEAKRLEATWVEPAPPGAGVPALLRVPAAAAKNRRERVAALPQPALDIIKGRLKENPGRTFIFSQSNFKKAMRAASKRAGLAHPLTLRDLRHTYATLAMQGTSDATAVQAALGHADLKTTQRYLSTTVDRTVSAGAAVADVLTDLGNRHTSTGIPDSEGDISAENHWSGRRGSNSRPSAWEAGSQGASACFCCIQRCLREHQNSHVCTSDPAYQTGIPAEPKIFLQPALDDAKLTVVGGRTVR